ncbi:uroporphyrinogen decarboxylase family protein [Desulfitobacterium sp. AusDCA]|uniref:uroporphyrinogen decarboxylase family protein n=1 Tax=Desulfitobacterium sp. AusDCA TaxID=3240383 RepID=UPI003DA73F43
MNHRERVLAVLNKKIPDRVPLDLCNSSNFINDPAYFALKKYLNIKEDAIQFRKNFTANYYDENLLKALDIDFRHVWLNPPKGYQNKTYPDGTFSDEWGVVYKLLGNERAIVKYPLKDASESDLDKYPWPDPKAPGRTEGLAERARSLYENTDCAIAAHAAHTYGFFDTAWIMRGFNDFLIDLMINKSFAHKLLGKILDIFLGLYDVYLDAVGPYIHTVTHCEDYGMQTAPFISPALYKEMIQPYHKELFAFIKKKAPQVKIIFHSCGAVYPLIPYLIEAGIDVLNPIQHLAQGMDPVKIKKEFGSQIVFHGAIDIQQALAGSVQDVEKEVKQMIDELGQNGGYIVAPANVVQGETPPENVVCLYRTAAEYGRY